MSNDIRTVLVIFFILINLIALISFAVDKWKAVNQRWRIKEVTLIGLCVLGGSIGGLSGMCLFHHKTKKPLFFIGIPIKMTAQIAAIGAVYYFMGS